ncbi:MAG: efflux RND transporter periplasmic adaptor subunit [Sandaracinaceae bacterium]|nr:efflux RND transporter periplasmic adaptor subunit [Sandaracinaceae bacterium]
MSEPALRPPPPLAKRIAALLVASVVGALGFFVVGRLGEAMEAQAALETEREAVAERAGEVPEVAVIAPLPVEAAPVVILTGTLEPAQAADLAFAVPGRVASVDVRLGQRVAAGDVLVQLDRRSVGAQSAQTAAAIGVAEANVEMARDRVRMLEPLVRAGSMAERELTTARQQLAISEAQLAQARAGQRQIAATSSDHVLRAPFAGLVTRVPSGVGVPATPGVALVRVEDLSSLRLRTTVNERDLDGLEVGAPVTLEGARGAGTIEALVRSLDAQTRRAPVEVRVDNAAGALVANAFVRARIPRGARRPVLRIPATAMRVGGSVLVVGEGSRLVARVVTAEADEDGAWLVSDGLSVEDRVAVRAALAREGAVIRPALVTAEGSAPTAELTR